MASALQASFVSCCVTRALYDLTHRSQHNPAEMATILTLPSEVLDLVAPHVRSHDQPHKLAELACLASLRFVNKAFAAAFSTLLILSHVWLESTGKNV